MSGETFTYNRCSACGLIFLASVPADLGAYYPAEYYGNPRTIADVERAAPDEDLKVVTVQKFVRGGCLLEVGPSRGDFAHRAKLAGFQVTAIERDPGCCDFLERTLGIEAVNAIDPVAALAGLETFDAIVLWQVIEHLDEPWRFLAAAADRLNPGGYLFIGTPNPDSWQFKVFGRRWYHLDAPRHLQLIPARVLREAGAANGLKERLCTSALGEDMNSNNRLGWQVSPRHYSRRLFSGKFGQRIMGKLAHTIRAKEQEEMRGSTYTMVLQKPAQPGR